MPAKCFWICRECFSIPARMVMFWFRCGRIWTGLNGILELCRKDIRINLEYLRSLEVPKLFLQPFVENAIVHGFKNYQDSGKIWISAEEEENDILFYVEDNGCGICEEDLKEVLNKERKSIGVRNTNKRIRMIYGEKYGVTISSQLEEGTVVTIRLPLKVNSKKQS